MSGFHWRWKVSGWALLVLVMGFGAASVAQAQEVGLQEIIVEGNQRIEAETVQFYLELNPGDVVSPGEINASLRALQDTGLFEDVALELRDSTLIVRVRERPFVNNVSFEGNDIVDSETLAAGIRTRSRTVYSPATVEADAARIVDLYARSGRLAAMVVPKYIERDNNRVDIVFEIDEGPISRVRRIAFIGNRIFSDWTLRRVVNSREAAWYRIFASTDLFDAGPAGGGQGLAQPVLRWPRLRGFRSAICGRIPDGKRFGVRDHDHRGRRRTLQFRRGVPRIRVGGYRQRRASRTDQL